MLAASAVAQNTVQSADFNLILTSTTNSTLNGSYLSACHTGAAIESLCLSSQFPIAPGVFNFNTSQYNVTYNETLGEPGWVTYVLRGGNFNWSEPLGLSYNYDSNVALPLFYPGTDQAVQFAFDPSDNLHIQSYVDDTVFPVAIETRAYYRWYLCNTYYTAYTYQNLVWVMGKYPPQNPTCTPVGVKRVFI